MKKEGEIAKKPCWGCATNLLPEQRICIECMSWQNWRRHLSLSNSTIALLIAFISALTLLVSNIANNYKKLRPLREIHISGSFSPTEENIVLDVYNFGDVPANLASNIRCVFDLENAISFPENTLEGKEVEFWTLDNRIVTENANSQIIYKSQIPNVEWGNEQVICTSAANYIGRKTPTDYFLLTIIPKEGSSWWAMGTHFDDIGIVDRLYPREFPPKTPHPSAL